MANAQIVVPRFVIERGKEIPVDSNGFLMCWEQGFQDDDLPVYSVENFRDAECLVLLGEPGMGKTTTLRQEIQVARSSVLSLLTLKLLDKERHSHVDDFNFDTALALFAGLNVLPKKSFASDYCYRTQRSHQRQLLAGWMQRLAPLLLPDAQAFLWIFIRFLTGVRMPFWRITTSPALLSVAKTTRRLCYASQRASQPKRTVFFRH